MADLCSYPRGCTNSMTVHQKNVTERLYGKPYCIEHQDYANQEASKASDAIMIDIKPYTKNGWEIDTRGNACKTIDGKDVRINIAYVDSGRKKTGSIIINNKPYIYGDNINVDIEINKLFKEIKPHGLSNKDETIKNSLSNESESKEAGSSSISDNIKSIDNNKKEDMKAMNENTNVIPKNTDTKAVQLSDAERDNIIEMAKAKKFVEQQGGSYTVTGKNRPDSAMIQKLANADGISTEILLAEQTNDYAKVIVRGHLGDKYIDSVIYHDFEVEKQLLMMEMIENAYKNKNDILDHYDGMIPILKDGAKILKNGVWIDAKYHLVHRLLTFISFALRDATTKAMAIVQLKLMNREARSPDEIESEQTEKDRVEATKNNRFRK